MFKLSDRVKQTSSTTGIVSVVLDGSLSGFQTFEQGVGDGNTTFYAIENYEKFEIGIGTYTSSTNTLSRDTVLLSSNSNNKVDLQGVSTIFVTYPADKTVALDTDGLITGFDGDYAGIKFPDGTTQNTASKAETVTSLTSDATNEKLIYTDELGIANHIDMSWYIDDTNLARLVSGSLDIDGIATFTRDDNTTFTLDFSPLYDDTNLAKIISGSISCDDRQVIFSRDDESTFAVDLSCLLFDNHFISEGLMKTDGAGVYSIVTDNSTNWNTAYGWGNHANEGYLNPDTSERTDNFIPKFSNLDLVKSVITNTGSLVSIAPTVSALTGTPNADQQTNKLRLYDVAGDGVIGFGVSTDSFNIATSGDIKQRFFTNSTERMRITADGKVGIGNFDTLLSNPNTVGNEIGLHLASSRFPEVHFTNDNSGHTAFDGANIQLYASAESNATSRLITTSRDPGSFIQFYTFNSAGVTKQRISTGPSETLINGAKDNHDLRVLGEVDNYLLLCDANTNTVNVGYTNDGLNTKFYVRADRTNYAVQSAGSGYSRVASVFGRDTVTGNGTNYQTGLNCRAEKKVYNTKTDSGYVIAGNFVALHDYAGTVNEVTAVRANAGGYTSHNGVINNLYSIKTIPFNQGTGTITNSYGLHLGANPISTNHSFGIYQSHRGDTNYFAGDSHFSSIASTPAYNDETIVIQPWKNNPNIYNGITRSDFANSAYMMISDGLHTYVSSNAGGITYLRGPNNSSSSEIRLKSSEVVINENGTSSDLRVESASLVDFLHQDASANTIAIYNAVGYGVNYATSRGWEQTSSSLNSDQLGYFGGDFSKKGSYVKNYVEHDNLPDNSRGLVWKSRNNSPNPNPEGISSNDFNPDGGWDKYIKGLDPNKAYISIVYVKRVSTNKNGNFYHGCNTSTTSNMNGGNASNPYFNVCDVSSLPKDVWCVSIGLIYGNNDSKTSETRTLGGIYRTDTGGKLNLLSTTGTNGNRDYKMKADATVQYHRTYLFYDNVGDTEVDWCWPGFYELDSEYARNFLSLFPTHQVIADAASTTQESGRRYVQNIELDDYGHITDITHAEETVVNTDTKRTNEEIQDLVALMLTTGNHTNISVSYDDTDPQGSIDLTASGGGGNGGGDSTRSHVTINSNTTLSNQNTAEVVLISTLSSDIQVILPFASLLEGKTISFKFNSNQNKCTIFSQSVDYIDGSNSTVLQYKHESISCFSDGDDWYIL